MLAQGVARASKGAPTKDPRESTAQCPRMRARLGVRQPATGTASHRARSVLVLVRCSTGDHTSTGAGPVHRFGGGPADVSSSAVPDTGARMPEGWSLSPQSLAAVRHIPSHGIGSSVTLGWRSVLAHSWEHPVETEAFTTAPTPDLLVGIGLSGTYTLEGRRPRGWSRVTLRPGSVGVTAPGTSSTLRWRRASPRPVSLHLYLSAALLEGTAEALGSPRLVEQLPDALLLEDTTVLSIGRALGVAMEKEAEPLYADSLAQALAAHMLYGRLLRSGPRRPAPLEGPAPAFKRVVDHMHDHISEELTLDDLAAVAGLSRYQLLRTFKQVMGRTPHRYLVSIRMRHAAELMRRTDHSVAQVAALCGYVSPGQFITAFGRQYGTSPGRYRREVKD